jgi:hypothetical protein
LRRGRLKNFRFEQLRDAPLVVAARQEARLHATPEQRA